MQSYTKYIEHAGLTEHESSALENFLFNFYSSYGNRFSPGNCALIPDLTEFARKAQITTFLGGFFERINPKRYLRSHFFLAAKSRRDKDDLIIDPTGVPLNHGDLKLKSIVPYFGLKSRATGFHKHVYDNMNEMDDWGTRDLPPRFRP